MCNVPWASAPGNAAPPLAPQPNIVHWIPKEDAEQLVRDGLASRMSDNDIFEMGADG